MSKFIEYIHSLANGSNDAMIEAAAAGYVAMGEDMPEYDPEFNHRVISAILALKRHEPGQYIRVLGQRLSDGIGSTTDFDNLRDIESALLSARWLPYESDNITDGMLGAITYDIPGHLGIIPLAELPPRMPVTLNDDKHTGFLSPSVRINAKSDVSYTVLIFGSDDVDGDNGYEYMRTFHPGPPLPQSTFETGTEELVDGDVISVRQAMNLGFDYAKIV